MSSLQTSLYMYSLNLTVLTFTGWTSGTSYYYDYKNSIDLRDKLDYIVAIYVLQMDYRTGFGLSGITFSWVEVYSYTI